MRRRHVLLACMALAWPLAASAGAFWDVPDDHRYATSIEYARQNGYIGGYPDGTLRPGNLMNRAEFVAILMRYAYGANSPLLSDCVSIWPYSDAPPQAWYSRYLCRATDQGIVDGYADDTFRPNNPINFAEAAKIISIVDVATGKGAALPDPDGGPWYKQYVDHLALRRAAPLEIRSVDEFVTRGEMLEMLYRLDQSPDTSARTYEDLGQVSWRTVVDECVDEPSENRDGVIQYPIRPVFKHLGFLGELLTAEECTVRRLEEVAGGDRDDQLGAYSSLKLSKLPVRDFRRYLEQIGYHCQVNLEADMCREWGNPPTTLSVGALLGLRPYADSIASFACKTCAARR